MEAQLDASNEFEKEMDLELESRLQAAETSGGIRQQDRVGGPSQSKQKKTDDFWESDDEDEYFDEWDKDLKNDKDTKKKEVNDDLFYDPNMDDEDQKWVEDGRKDDNRGRFKQKEKPLPNSDAVLNCPACFIVLCLDCQRHETFDTQYRAMFVRNCTVDQSKQLKYPEKGKGKRKRKKEENPSPAVDPSDVFNPVNCDRCTTQVAVYDRDEIYHFFNVLASY
jgi:hypothetical protein